MSASRLQTNGPAIALGIVLGLVAGFLATLVLWITGPQIELVLSAILPVRAASPAGAEFTVNSRQAWVYLAELIAVGAGLGAILGVRRFRPSAPFVRSLVTSALFVMLGGMALCNLFSVGSLFSRG